MQLANIRSDLNGVYKKTTTRFAIESNDGIDSSVAMHLIKKTNRYYAVTHHNDYDN